MSQQPPGKEKEYALHSIGRWQVFFLVQNTMVAVGLLTLPRVLSEAAGHSGWMALPVAGCVAQVALWFIFKLLHRFHYLDLYAILRLLLGKWVGNLLGLFFAAYCLLAAILAVRAYVEVVQTWLFPTTSTPLFYFLLLIPLFYCAAGGARVVGRFATIAFLGTIWMMLFLLAPAKEISLDNYLPIFNVNFLDLSVATLHGFTSFLGFELMLVFAPYIQDRKRSFALASGGMWFNALFIYLVATLVCIGFYSQGQLESILSPTIHLFQIVHLPVIERIEHIGIATWSFLVISTAVSYIWAAGRFLAQWPRFHSANRVYWLVPFLFLFAYWPKNYFVLTKFESMIGILGTGVSIGLAPLLLIYAIVFRKKQKTGSSDDPAFVTQEN